MKDRQFDMMCVGELNVDLILSGVRQAPVFGKEILAEDYTECMGSSTAICACVAASLGLNVGFYGKLGQDRYGDIVMEALRRYGVSERYIERQPRYRTGLTVSVSSSSDRAMVTCFGDTIDAFEADEVRLEGMGARHIHAGSYFIQPRLRKGIPSLYARAHALGMTTSLDAGWDEYGRWGGDLEDTLRHTDYFFPNEKEAEAIAGTSDLEQAAVRIARMGCNCIVKMGGQGALLCEKYSDAPRHFAPYKTSVVDTTGAGDSFNAGFLTARLSGLDYEDCMRWGNASGAVSVTRTGGSTRCPARDEVEQTIRSGCVPGL